MNTVGTSVNIFWFRRDLRLTDNAGLFHALSQDLPVLPIFIFDKSILEKLNDKSDRRVTFIYDALKKINGDLFHYKSSIKILNDPPVKAFETLLAEFNVKSVFTNHDYEPYATTRDNEIKKLLNLKGISFYSYKDQVIFEKDEVVKKDGSPYSVFTPYSKRWKQKLSEENNVNAFNTEKYYANFFPFKTSFPSLNSIGFKENRTFLPEPNLTRKALTEYHLHRDALHKDATTHVGLHLRFGTISVRQVARIAGSTSEKYFNELIWREFFMQILWHYPYVSEGPFKKKYERIKWHNNEDLFAKWCKGETGFPIVDAGMRELNETGFMHNRARMITANFLIKILFIDWRWGEAYFAEKLSDFELASNNGNWQWSAGCGCDAAPYFRIFNPYKQTERFDPHNYYIKKWIPGFKPDEYIKPIIDFNSARNCTLQEFQKAL